MPVKFQQRHRKLIRNEKQIEYLKIFSFQITVYSAGRNQPDITGGGLLPAGRIGIMQHLALQDKNHFRKLLFVRRHIRLSIEKTAQRKKFVFGKK